jgi:ABC-2 type transporter
VATAHERTGIVAPAGRVTCTTTLLRCAAIVSASTARQYGPTALGGDLRRFAELTLTLARTEFKVRYFGSVLGYLWSLMRPLLFFSVIYFFFVKILRIARGPHYGVYLLAGLVLWGYFAEATSNCVTCLVAREALLRKIRFPRMVVPLSVSLTAIFNLALNTIVVIAFALVDGVTPTIRWLELLPIVLGFIVLAMGFGMLLSALYSGSATCSQSGMSPSRRGFTPRRSCTRPSNTARSRRAWSTSCCSARRRRCSPRWVTRWWIRATTDRPRPSRAGGGR